jgi:hypothetical protein
MRRLLAEGAGTRATPLSQHAGHVEMKIKVLNRELVIYVSTTTNIKRLAICHWLVRM